MHGMRELDPQRKAISSGLLVFSSPFLAIHVLACKIIEVNSDGAPSKWLFGLFWIGITVTLAGFFFF
jgi:hypothetical protein